MKSVRTFLKDYPLKRFRRGDVILHQDEEPPAAYAVESGVVKAYNLTTKGEEKPIQFHVKDDIFPLGWVFGKIYQSQYYYEAANDCSLYCVPRSEMAAYLKHCPEATLEMLEHSLETQLHDHLRINALEQSRAFDKIVAIIHYFALRFGQDLEKDVVEIPLPLRQQDVANFTGLTRETVSAEFKRLARRSVISYHNRSYIVLTNRLNELIDDTYEYRFVR